MGFKPAIFFSLSSFSQKSNKVNNAEHPLVVVRKREECGRRRERKSEGEKRFIDTLKEGREREK